MLERFGLDHEQAEALTRITSERALSWFSRWASTLPGSESLGELVERPTHPDALRRGLELYRKRRGMDDPES